MVRNFLIFSKGDLSRMVLEFGISVVLMPFLKLDVILFPQEGLQVFFAPTVKLCHISLVLVRKVLTVLFWGHQLFVQRGLFLLLFYLLLF